MRYFSFDRLYANWVYGGTLAGLLMLGLLPVFSRGWDLPMILVFLQLPIYMLHQYEEHDADRFRQFVNETLGKGQELLTLFDVFFINIFGVWGVNLIGVYLALYVDIGFGLIGVYLTLINAIAHIGQGVLMRRYNPGLATAVLFFLPVGGLALWAISKHTTVQLQCLGLFSAVAIHAMIIIHVVRKKRKLSGLR